MGGLSRPIPRPAHRPPHSFDKTVTLPQFLELLRGQFQPRVLDQNGKALRRNRLFGHGVSSLSER
jgi:hypothetical protein